MKTIIVATQKRFLNLLVEHVQITRSEKQKASLPIYFQLCQLRDLMTVVVLEQMLPCVLIGAVMKL